MKYFNNCSSLNEVKAQYKSLVKLHHPDISGYDSTAVMQEINKEYSYAIVNIAKGSNMTAQDIESEILNAENYKTAVSIVSNLQGVTVELCGAWLWVSGNTFIYKDTLRGAGFLWASAKKMWYFRGVEYAIESKGKTKSIGEIRIKYGSQQIASGTGWNAFLSA